jgi:MoaA/NifB/PqqE/SkfB family radical SAM enzyme
MLAKMMGVRIFDLEACGACNLACTFCPRDALPPAGVMSQATYTRFLDQVELRATDSLSFVGVGEPTMNPLLPDFIRQAKARYPKVRTWVTSNGTKLNDKVVARLIDAGLDTIDVSFNGLDAHTYESQMKGAKFDQVLENLTYTAAQIAARGSKLKLQINYIITKENADHEWEIIEFWNKRGISDFRVQRMHNRAGLTEVEGMTPIDEPGLKCASCALFETVTFITWQGDVMYCCHDIPRTHKIGNINADTWQMLSARKKDIIMTGNWPSMCGSCSDPYRYDMTDKIDAMIRKEAEQRIVGGVRTSLGALRKMVGLGR